jgi:hypothetical protein
MNYECSIIAELNRNPPMLTLSVTAIHYFAVYHG